MSDQEDLAKLIRVKLKKEDPGTYPEEPLWSLWEYTPAQTP